MRRYTCALLTCVICGCGSDASGPDGANESRELDLLRIDSFTPGAVATLHATGVRSITELNVDGVIVAGLNVLTDSTATFTVPVTVVCVLTEFVVVESNAC